MTQVSTLWPGIGLMLDKTVHNGGEAVTQRKKMEWILGRHMGGCRFHSLTCFLRCERGIITVIPHGLSEA